MQAVVTASCLVLETKSLLPFKPYLFVSTVSILKPTILLYFTASSDLGSSVILETNIISGTYNLIEQSNQAKRKSLYAKSYEESLMCESIPSASIPRGEFRGRGIGHLVVDSVPIPRAFENNNNKKACFVTSCRHFRRRSESRVSSSQALSFWSR